MRLLILLFTLLALIPGCSKEASWLPPSPGNYILPDSSSLVFTYGPNIAQFSNGINSCWRNKDTLFINSFTSANYIQLFFIAKEIKDSVYTLDGRNGDFRIYDRNRNCIGLIGSGSFQFSIASHKDNKLFGYLNGRLTDLNSNVGMPVVDGFFTNLSVQYAW